MLEEVFGECLTISEAKSSDYADIDDPFKNFRATEVLGVSMELGILVRMMDKMVRASNLLKRPAKVVDEKLDDTFKDIANYAAILAVAIKEKETNNTNN